MSDVAEDPIILQNFPAISQALLLTASPQIRNMASVGGNLMQRTRCLYFRGADFACNKRAPGSGCSALEGENRQHAILGTSSACVATHPSDLAVALVALGASLRLRGASGERSVALEDFFLLPGDTPERETVLANLEKTAPLAAAAGPLGASLGLPAGAALQGMAQFLGGSGIQVEPKRFHVADAERNEVVAQVYKVVANGLEGQKIVAVELCEQLSWDAPDWVVIPGGNLGNISALGKGFALARRLGLLERSPRLACAQASRANPLYLSYRDGFRERRLGGGKP